MYAESWEVPSWLEGALQKEVTVAAAAMVGSLSGCDLNFFLCYPPLVQLGHYYFRLKRGVRVASTRQSGFMLVTFHCCERGSVEQE